MPTIEEILGDIPKEGTEPFKDLGKDTPSDSPAEKKPEEQKEEDKPKEGDDTPKDDVPFHKHPRWIERENELKELRERDEEQARELADLKTFKEETSRRLSPDSTIPEWFSRLYGDNAEAYKAYEEHERIRTEEIEKRILTRQEEARRKIDEDSIRWQKWVASEIEKLQADTGIDFTTKNDVLPNGEKTNAKRNELIKIMLDYRPTDEDNNFDFKKGYKLYEALKEKEDPEKSRARKAIADNATKTSPGEKPPKDYRTTAELRGRSWGNLLD